jgi:putative phosphoribosyl transferase
LEKWLGCQPAADQAFRKEVIMGLFRDRFDAGRFLAGKLLRYEGDPDLLVLALPRGGVPVGYEVARALGAPLDVLLVRKLGLPGHEELAMGAVASGGLQVLNKEILQEFVVSQEMIARVAEREQKEIKRQYDAYRQGRSTPDIAGKIVILVDDGLATGATMRAAVRALRQQDPRRIVVAVPVGAPETCSAMNDEADEVVCAQDPELFMSVGSWYEDFSPTSDQTVQCLLRESDQWDQSSHLASSTK